MNKLVYIPKEKKRTANRVDAKGHTYVPSQKPPKKKKKRAKKIFLTTAGVTAGLIGALIGYNEIRTHLINSTHQSVDNFSPDRVFDNNDNDFTVDENNQIVLDDMTEEEKKLLTGEIEEFILQDVQYSLDIDHVEEIWSIAMLPSNLYSGDEGNMYDKYRLSILFTDGNVPFTLNYYTGGEFASDEELSTNYVADFITYLSGVYLDGCEAMSEMGKSILAAIDGAIFVGDAYVGYEDSGDANYYVPVYYEDGSAKVYHAMKSLIDRDNLDPMQELLKERQLGEEKLFSVADVETPASIQKIVDIYYAVKGNAEEKSNAEENADLGLN